MRVIIHAYRRDREKGHKTDWSVAVIALSKVSSDIKAVWELNAGFNATMAFGEWVGEFRSDSSVFGFYD